MALEPIVVTVDADMADLVPLFLTQRKADQKAVAAAIAARDFDAIRKIGHAMAGAGTSYGFEALSLLGDRLGHAARVADVAALEALRREFDDYMARLNVNYL